MKTLLAALLAALAFGAQAQDALRGKRLYLDADRLVGSGVSCVDCHGGLPGGAFGIGKAANDPDVIERAVAAIAPMAPFRARLSAQDFADLAAFIGNPGVPSPDLRLTTTAPAGGVAATDRIDFGEVAPGASSAVGSMQLVNVGLLPLALVSAPRIVGAGAAEFSVVGSDCRAPSSLQPQQACRIDLVFRPVGGSGPRTAAVQVDHDWVEGLAALALIGNAKAPAASPPAPSGAGTGTGGGGGVGIAALGVALAAWARRRVARPVEGRPD
jgi:cytochrome c553